MRPGSWDQRPLSTNVRGKVARIAPPDGTTLSWQGAASVCALAMGKVCILAWQILLARRLGAGGYGAFLVAFTIASLSLRAASFGIPKIVTRDIVRMQSRSLFQAGRAVALQGTKGILISSGLVAIVIIATVKPLAQLFLGGSRDWILIALAGLSLPFFALFNLTQAILHATQRIITKQFLHDVGRPILLLAISWALLSLVPKPAYAMVAYCTTGALLVFVGALAAIYVLRHMRGRYDDPNPTLKPIGLGRLFLNSSPFVLGGLLYQGATSLDRLMLGALASKTSVGRYGAAASIAQQVGGVSVAAVAVVVLPVLARLALNSRDYHHLRSFYRQTTKWMITIGVVMAMLSLILKRFLLGLYGAEFGEATSVLVVLIVGQLAFVMVGPSGELLQMGGHEKLDLKNTAAMLLLNLVLNTVLIPSFGALGAALATVLSIATISVGQLLELHYLYGILPLRQLRARPKIGLLCLLILTAVAGISDDRGRVGLWLVAAMTVSSVVIWKMLMTDSEKRFVAGAAKQVRCLLVSGRSGL